MSWAQGWGHGVFRKAATGISSEGEASTLWVGSSWCQNGVLVPTLTPGPCPSPGALTLHGPRGLLQPWPWLCASAHWNLVPSSLYEVNEVETSHPTPSPSPHSTIRPHHPPGPCEEWTPYPSLLQPAPGGSHGPASHSLFFSSLRLRGHVRGLEEFHFSFNGGPLEPRLAEVKVRVR